MKKDWTYKKLGEVCEKITDGSHNPPKGVMYSNFRMLSSQNIFNHYIDYNAGVRYVSEVDYNVENRRTSLQADDVLMTIVGTIGRSCVVSDNDKNIVLQRSVAVLRPKKDIVLSHYLSYSIHGLNEKINKEAHGIAQKGIYLRQLSDISIPIPPLSIQRSIVSELDLLHSLIEKKQEQLRALDNLAQSLFYQMFGDESKWESATLKEVCSSIVRGPFGSALKKDFFVPKNDTTYKVYEQKHAIQKDAFIGSYYITKEKFTELKRFEVFPNDIIMSCSGTIGELFVIPNNAEKGVMNQALLKFHLNELITIPYFMFIMEYVKGKMTIQGCGLQNIGSVKEICKIDFPLPPLSLQQSFAAKVSAIEEQKRFITQSIKDVESLLAQRMDHYFG